MAKTKPKTTKKVVKKNKGGRPSKYEAGKVKKLESAFINSFTVDQACIYAGVRKQTFYNWLESKPGFLDKMTKAREQPTMKAKQIVVDAVNAGDVGSAKWWLERKARDEFAPPKDPVNPNVTNNFITLVSKDRDAFTIPDSV